MNDNSMPAREVLHEESFMHRSVYICIAIPIPDQQKPAVSTAFKSTVIYNSMKYFPSAYIPLTPLLTPLPPLAAPRALKALLFLNIGAFRNISGITKNRT